MEQIIHVIYVLVGQRIVQAKLLPDLHQLLLGGFLSRHLPRGVAGDHMEKQKNQN